MKDKTIEQLIILINEILGTEDFELKLEEYKDGDTIYFKLFKEYSDGRISVLVNEWNSQLVHWYLHGMAHGLTCIN
ncbi:MAG: hypothetical protein KAS32_30275 [Candidatus Peribacteraceae bacterium]|nr:hypothetical protein [Candidatus Peribacteraceae bacterium]